MRLWSLHPKYLDAAGLVALWREALLAQAVLRGRTRGYRHHPQLARFRECRAPVAAIATYLRVIHREACERGYSFDAGRIARARTTIRLTVTRGQIDHEWKHLRRKLEQRKSGVALARLRASARPAAHPMFGVVPGGPAVWEGSRTTGRRPGSRAGPVTEERRNGRLQHQPGRQVRAAGDD